MKKIGISIIIVLVIMSITGLFIFQNNKGTETEYQYGTVSEGTIPKQFELVELTIPVVDETGESSSRTFSVNTEDEFRPYVKLHVRNDKVIKYEFVEKGDLPSEALKHLE